MSYYFVIIGTQDNPLFEHEFGTSKQGGDGLSRFSDESRHMNQFIVHSSLDIVEEVQWGTGQMYLKNIDRFFNSYISCFMTPSNTKFLLLHQPIPPTGGSPQTEEAVKNFFTEVYENWVKASMSPFYRLNQEITSPVFRQRIAAAGRKYL
ncbi:Sedlin [Truncatella angustata]|uniref:Sedlin n=1 Tax=Truncatella angustata TaxID=152316 RepID=A0A9P8ULX9_9PEZI|nr:Sedlin [Truncatella angustata]KAH6654614.1 Sedlin [Truncatella angustata]